MSIRTKLMSFLGLSAVITTLGISNPTYSRPGEPFVGKTNVRKHSHRTGNGLEGKVIAWRKKNKVARRSRVLNMKRAKGKN